MVYVKDLMELKKNYFGENYKRFSNRLGYVSQTCAINIQER